ncbi:hypothetical protein ElyMa_003958600 [Elysia marginata]|uniref:Uncharacterized protein n=1 Tax=Elysia marginata TaxID=1093978 RepID=A0AAV4FUV9_9GAST|nr:hypothetical protein ElyMa_003958600 [Elysia marginata]
MFTENEKDYETQPRNCGLNFTCHSVRHINVTSCLVQGDGGGIGEDDNDDDNNNDDDDDDDDDDDEDDDDDDENKN